MNHEPRNLAKTTRRQPASVLTRALVFQTPDCAAASTADKEPGPAERFGTQSLGWRGVSKKPLHFPAADCTVLDTRGAGRAGFGWRG
jgi:hypothetical protein